MNSLEVFSFQSSKIIGFDDDVVEDFFYVLDKEQFVLEEDDTIVITSKVLSMQDRAAVRISQVEPSERARELSEKAKMDPRVVQLVLDESEGEVYGAVFHAILAKTRYGLSANAGLDMSNAPEGYALLLPREPDETAKYIRKRVMERYQKRVSVIISDSKTIPLRRGTTAVAIGVAGMNPLIDERGKKDLYGYEMSITTRAIADNIATAANLLMGETTERAPFAVVRGAKYEVKENVSMKEALMPEDQCLYFAPLLDLIENQND